MTDATQTAKQVAKPDTEDLRFGCKVFGAMAFIIILGLTSVQPEGRWLAAVGGSFTLACGLYYAIIGAIKFAKSFDK